jgi:L-asparaginase/Glu-tRNA(Gln) amidotransferase subunit D
MQATNPKQPAATLDGAIGKTTANNGDLILVHPGHSETLSAAAAITCDVAGVTIVGLGTGNNRPTFTLDTATSTGHRRDRR